MIGELSSVWWILLLLGFIGGTVSGSFGVGAGVVFVPALVILFRGEVTQKSAQATALWVMVPMASVAALRYWTISKNNPEIVINFGLIGLLVVGALFGVFLGVYIARTLPSYWLRKGFAVFMVVVAVRMFVMTPKPTAPADDGSAAPVVEESS